MSYVKNLSSSFFLFFCSLPLSPLSLSLYNFIPNSINFTLNFVKPFHPNRFFLTPSLSEVLSVLFVCDKQEKQEEKDEGKIVLKCVADRSVRRIYTRTCLTSFRFPNFFTRLTPRLLVSVLVSVLASVLVSVLASVFSKVTF